MIWIAMAYQPATALIVDKGEAVRIDAEADVMAMLEATSRTFYIPISRLPAGLRHATASAYLCMRAIDEIEDHPDLTNVAKCDLLKQISLAFQSHAYAKGADIQHALGMIFNSCGHDLPAVSLALGKWARYAPEKIAPRIWADTAAMADRMAYWASVGWRIRHRDDLNAYTYSVAATVGLLMCDVLAWFDGTQLDRAQAICFGRGLQVTNIVRNRADDLARGVDFYPPGWTDEHVRGYALHLLSQTEKYAETLPPKPFSYFIKIPLALAQATLTTLAQGKMKLTRDAVMAIISNGYARNVAEV
jgi:farnesyl-diphosphate farnesyltransferase